MGDKLLVRCYNVGCGDCIYVGIPDEDEWFHILIDCGTKESERSGLLKRAIEHIEANLLSDIPGEPWKRLDLLVVTHRHEDHIKGLNAEYFANIAIGNIWVTAGMNAAHEQAQQANALHERAVRAVDALHASGAKLSPELQGIFELYRINNEGASTAVLETLPEANQIETQYVHAGMSAHSLGVPLPAHTTITVLAPEADIDGYYLGKEASDRLRSLAHTSELADEHDEPVSVPTPANIGEKDFAVLRSRMMSNALAFVAGDTGIQNNVSTVLLIQWQTKRLLFVGDAEWSGTYREGKQNGSWNVMWKEQHDKLNAPIDFLKVGHHGSHNATPWNRHADSSHEVNQLLDAILPKPGPGQTPTAQCVVSTKRKQYDTIPDAELLVELGKRTANTRNYLEYLRDTVPDFDPDTDIYNYSVPKRYSTEPRLREVGDKGWLDQPQPRRTDLESIARADEHLSDSVEFIDTFISTD